MEPPLTAADNLTDAAAPPTAADDLMAVASPPTAADDLTDVEPPPTAADDLTDIHRSQPPLASASSSKTRQKRKHHLADDLSQFYQPISNKRKRLPVVRY